jgi:UDPglucose 6-dehydrogenase
MGNARELFPTLVYADTPEQAADGAHVVLHLTEWQEFRDLDPAKVAEVVSTPHIIDGRNTLDPHLWRAAGWTYRALGRPQA